MRLLLTQIPFPGFYESSFGKGIDAAEQDRADDLVNDDPGMASVLGVAITSEDCVAAFSDACDYDSVRTSISEDFVEAFDSHFRQATGIALDLRFESVESPREYNCSTDRIFCHVPYLAVRRLRRHLLDHHRDALQLLLQDQLTDRDGFAASYTPILDEWLEKPLSTWDHNEIFMLLTAALISEDCWEDSIHERMWEDGCFHDAHDAAVDRGEFLDSLRKAAARRPSPAGSGSTARTSDLQDPDEPS